MFAQESVMEIQKIPTLAEKQEFWAEQLPNFEATYWLPSHFEYVIFDMEQGNYVIKDDLSPDFEGDATEIWHRVNTGWAMWKKAINFGRKQPQAVPEGFVLVKKELPEQIAEKMAIDRIDKPRHENDPVWREIAEQSYKDQVKSKKWEFWRDYKAMIEAQEPTND